MPSESLKALIRGFMSAPPHGLVFPVSIFTVTGSGSPKLVLDSLKVSRQVGDLSMRLLQGPPIIFWPLKEVNGGGVMKSAGVSRPHPGSLFGSLGVGTEEREG